MKLYCFDPAVRQWSDKKWERVTRLNTHSDSRTSCLVARLLSFSLVIPAQAHARQRIPPYFGDNMGVHAIYHAGSPPVCRNKGEGGLLFNFQGGRS